MEFRTEPEWKIWLASVVVACLIGVFVYLAITHYSPFAFSVTLAIVLIPVLYEYERRRLERLPRKYSGRRKKARVDPTTASSRRMPS